MLQIESIKKVSIVIPVYNEQESLPILIAKISEVCQLLTQYCEIILVDDGSTDDSSYILTQAVKTTDRTIIAVILNRNYGQHAAIMAGFQQVSGDLIITLDADLQNPPEEIPRLVKIAEEGYDVVGTIRENRQDSYFRKTGSRLVNMIIQNATGKAMSDYGCMLRAYRRHIIEAMLRCHVRSTFIPILANIFARRTKEITVRHAKRSFGNSKYSLMKLLNLMYDLVTSLTITPMHLLSAFGSIIAIAGFILAFLLVILRLILGSFFVWGLVLTLFAILLIFIGAQFIGMGLIGKYIGSIYHDVCVSPNYLIEKIVRAKSEKNIQEKEQ